MDKTTILKMILSRGAQVDQGSLDFLVDNPNIVETVLKLDEKELPTVITLEFLKPLMPIGERVLDTNQKFSISQLSQVLNYRYEFLRKLLENKEELTNLISINKISEKLKEFSVIGMVSEKGYDVILEDSTGQANFALDKEKSKFIVEDEVVGFACEQYNGLFVVKNIIFPDIPLNKESKKAEGLEKCFFISDIHMDNPNFNSGCYQNLLNWLNKQENLKIFILGGISKNNEDSSKFLSDISHSIYFSENNIKHPITKQVDNMQIMLVRDTFLQDYMKLWNSPIGETVVNLFKKRNLNPTLTPTNYTNAFLLEEIPDIIVISGTNKPTLTNYKGTTIITTGSFLTEPIYWLINLQTRETFKTDFS